MEIRKNILPSVKIELIRKFLNDKLPIELVAARVKCSKCAVRSVRDGTVIKKE